MLDINEFNKIYDKIKIITESELRGSDKRSIINSLYKILNSNKIEGRYTDEHWEGPRRLERLLSRYVQYELAEPPQYYHNKDFQTQLPNGKRYVYNLTVTDNKGKTHIIPLQVMCAFVGKTGTMEDGTYELTYQFLA